MVAQLLQYSQQHLLLDFGDRVLLAVSGGVDSVVLAHLMAKSEYDCAIAHCNFQLRGAASEADEDFVRELAMQLEMEFYTERFDVETEMNEKGISLQMAARDLRYAWFNRIAEDHHFHHIATAHNLNDAVETFFLNLGRGTGIRGLTGIPPRNGRIIRPLLFACRKEIEAYARERNIAFREDASNRSTRYQRNKIRHDVIPHMESLNPSFLQTMAGNMQRLYRVQELVDESLEGIRKDIWHVESGQVRVSIPGLRALSPLSVWVHELFSPYGFNSRQCDDLLQLLDGSPGKRITSPTHELYKDRDFLILINSREEGFERYYLDRPENSEHLPFGLEVEVLEHRADAAIPQDRSVACLDFDEIQFPLTIRRWMPGDWFCPLGMDGQVKKLSDYFVDEKIPVPEKERTWILASGRKIVWIMGRRIDHRFRIRKDTRRVLRLHFQPDVAAEVSEK